MGLIFKPGEKFIATNKLDKNTIKEIAHDSGIIGKAKQYSLGKELLKARYGGGLKQKEVHDILQGEVNKGHISSAAKAGRIAKKFGMKLESLTKFQDASLRQSHLGSRAMEKTTVRSATNSITTRKKAGQSGSGAPLKPNFRATQYLSEAHEKAEFPAKTKTIWDLLNKPKIDQ